MLRILNFLNVHEHLDKRVLRKILTGIIIIDHTIDDGKNQSFMQGDKLGHCALITVLRTADQVRDSMGLCIQRLFRFIILLGE